MSEEKKSEITIILSDLIEVMDRNNIKAIVKQIDGVAFVNNTKTEKPKPKYTTKELLEKALLYMSDITAENRCARSLIKKALEEL